ncbi:MAG: aminotransferase class V-fold PLP-dependent enzyme, partial [Nitrospirota bacterium]
SSGGTGSRSDLDRMPDFLPDRFEAGTLNTPGIAGLAAGVEFLMGEGLENVRAHEVEIMTRLVSGISAIDGATLYGCSDPAGRTSVLSFTIEGVDPAFIGERLDRDFDIAVRVGLHCAPDAHRKMGSFPKGAVRMSPGYFTTLEDIDRAIEAVAEVAKTRSGKEALWTSR